MSPQGVFYCCVKGCFHKSTEYLSLFRFPNDQRRCSIWLTKCDRMDLVNYSPEYLHRNYRVCANHFENGMFGGMSRSRLKSTAVPTIFGNASSQDKDLDPTSTSENQSEHIASCSNAFIEANLESANEPGDISTQTSTSLMADSPRKHALRLSIKKLRKASEKKSVKISDEDVLKYCEERLSGTMLSLLKRNLELFNKTSKGARYDKEYKKLALTIYFLGPEVYKCMSKMCRLPSKSTLYRITRNWEINPGLNNFLFSLIECKVLNLVERDCVLCMDEMSIKFFLFYNTRRDDIIGFHETLNGKSFIPARSIFVLMARGLKSNWKQPIAYFLVDKISADEIKIIVEETISKLRLIGLKVRCLISDQGANFVQFVKISNITPEHPYFVLDAEKIFFMFDVPHLLKSLRNNFFKYTFVCTFGKTSKSHLELFYNSDKHLRLVPKLTEDHINPNGFKKMKVRLAAQVLSATVAAGLNTYIALGALKSDAIPTVTLIENVDKLFDIFNSSNFSDGKFFRKPFTGSAEQIDFLKEMYTFFDQLRVTTKDDVDVTKKMKFISGWKISISSLLALWSELQDNLKFPCTRRLNQDTLENFFGTLRQQSGNARNLTANQVHQAFKKIFCLDYFDHSEGANFLEDFDEILASVSPEKLNNFSKVLPDKHIFSNLQIGVSDYVELDLPKKNALHYISGYLIKKCLENHECIICKNYANENLTLNEETFFCFFKAYENKEKDTFGKLMMPPVNFIEYIFNLETVFCNLFPIYSVTSSVGTYIKQQLDHIPSPHPCTNFPKDFLLSLYTCLRIFYTLKYCNRELALSKSHQKDYKLTIIKNL